MELGTSVRGAGHGQWSRVLPVLGVFLADVESLRPQDPGTGVQCGSYADGRQPRHGDCIHGAVDCDPLLAVVRTDGVLQRPHAGSAGDELDHQSQCDAPDDGFLHRHCVLPLRRLAPRLAWNLRLPVLEMQITTKLQTRNTLQKQRQNCLCFSNE